jgi:hypothetical protein
MTAAPATRSRACPQYEITDDWPDGGMRPPDGPHWWRPLGRHDGMTAWVMVEPPPPGAEIERGGWRAFDETPGSELP